MPDGLPNLNGGLPPPADGFPWHPIPKTSILQLRLLRSLPSESAHPVTASKNLQFLIATTGKICYDESTNSSQNLNLTEGFYVSIEKIILVIVGIAFTLFGYFIFFKEKYSLINGFSSDYKAGRKNENYAKRVGIVEFIVGIVILIASVFLIILA